ncbi:MAG: UDP-3-O-(3-hydroxymyristoyl)glucosamine N-acyltransferase [Gemmatimonadota bacterium]|nr:UDP-3-O-(3-hydroxymyristoyl)glucosamine N-acyltransferase [Gemmatimonadota bacterium]
MFPEPAPPKSGDARPKSGGTWLTLVELAAMVGGRAEGDLDKHIAGVTSLAQAGPSDLGLLVDSRYSRAAGETAAGAILVSSNLEDMLDPAQSRVVVEDPRKTLPTVLEYFFSDPLPRPGLHETAIIAEDVKLGTGVSVGPYVVIEDNVVMGEGTTLHAHVVVRSGARLGRDVTLHPHVVVYPHVRLGDRVVLHAGVRVGVDGFGYAHSEGSLARIPHVGACIIGDDVEIGANSCVDRGSIGHTELGAHVKLDNLVHIGHNVTVGPRTVMAAQVAIAGSTKVGADTMWGGQAGAMDHISVGDGARIAARTGLTEDVPAGSTMAGFPARPLTDFLKAQALLFRLDSLRRRVRVLERRLDSREEGAASTPIPSRAAVIAPPGS